MSGELRSKRVFVPLPSGWVGARLNGFPALQSVRLETPWKTRGPSGRGPPLSSPIQGTISYMTARIGFLLERARKRPFRCFTGNCNDLWPDIVSVCSQNPPSETKPGSYASASRKSKLQVICALHPYDRLTKPLLIYRTFTVAMVEANHPFPWMRGVQLR